MVSDVEEQQPVTLSHLLFTFYLIITFYILVLSEEGRKWNILCKLSVSVCCEIVSMPIIVQMLSH